jgi:cytoskeletal protein CcmA (bactofilin family)
MTFADMLTLGRQKVRVTCPHCGHSEREDAASPFVVCGRCGQDYGLFQGRKPPVEVRPVTCVHCGAVLEVATAALSTICRQCSAHLDLCDYHVASIAFKSFKTTGRLIIEESGYVHDTGAVVGEAIIKGKFRGNLTAARSLTVHPTGQLMGTIRTARLIIPQRTRFVWPEEIRVREADIYGEVEAKLCAEDRVLLASSARFFGELQATRLIVEDGAVFVGTTRVGFPSRR